MPTLSPPPPAQAARAHAALCPFHDGLATLDLFLAELDPRHTELFDAALDLRSLCTARRDAAACIRQLLLVRTLLDGRHYLAFYRVRCWARRVFRIETRPHGVAPWVSDELPLNCARVDELINTALAAIATRELSPASAQVRFTFAPAA